jgi:hypothetical protein
MPLIRQTKMMIQERAKQPHRSQRMDPILSILLLMCNTRRLQCKNKENAAYFYLIQCPHYYFVFFGLVLQANVVVSAFIPVFGVFINVVRECMYAIARSEFYTSFYAQIRH